MLPIFASRRVRNEIREWLSLAQDVRDFALSIVRAVTGGHFDEAQALLDKKREQASGAAANKASNLAGARK